VLQNSPIEKVDGLIYKKAPVLMEHHPEMAVELFLSKQYLRITHLLPALYRYVFFFVDLILEDTRMY
jgi:hypothetical protein